MFDFDVHLALLNLRRRERNSSPPSKHPSAYGGKSAQMKVLPKISRPGQVARISRMNGACQSCRNSTAQEKANTATAHFMRESLGNKNATPNISKRNDANHAHQQGKAVGFAAKGVGIHGLSDGRVRE